MSLPRIVTERLVLRPWRPDDEGDVAAAYDMYRRDEVARFLGRTPRADRDVDDARDRLERYDALSTRVGEGLGVCAITAGDDGPVGTAMLKNLPDAEGVLTDDVEIGWHLHPDVWGRGYATEAASALLEQGWSIGLGEIHAVAYADNAPSLAVMHRIGMTRQGTTDRWYGVEMEWWRSTRP
jgi:RimJ/RimL family protein N-acetyltransferase